MVLLLLSFFILGAVTVVAVEVAGLWVLICRLNRKVQRQEFEAKAAGSVASPSDLNPSLCDKQGELWVLEPEKVPKLGLEDKVATEQRKKKDILEVAPVRKHARIKDHYLILTETDRPHVEIPLRGCTIVAVSATNLSSRKWAKRYPIKLERKDSAIYKGNNAIYIYLETSWEKESWCKALRLASCIDREKTLWFSKLSVEFHNYLASLNAGYPSFMKPYVHFGAEVMDKSVKLDNSSSKVRQFLNKFGRKGFKNGQEYKVSGIENSGLEHRKLSERSRSFQGKPPNVISDDTTLTSSVSEPGSSSHLSGTSDANSDFKNFDEGTVCFNLLISRLFFDVKNNEQIVMSIHNRIQRAISNMRIPNYIGGITCTAVDPGTLPPRILAMRVLPSDMNEVWAMEIDAEYLGGANLDIKTRLEIQELESEARLGNDTVGVVTSDLMEGIEHLGEELKLADETVDERKLKDGGNSGPDEKEDSKSIAGSSSQVPKWKSVLLSITKQVSQVPFTLGIRISSIRGTIRLSMKPPPSDQIWFAFSSMPDIEFNLESYLGDRIITSGHLALFLINRIKAGVRDTIVLPNRESISIPGMLAEKDDWVPRKVAPFMWYRSNSNHDSTSNTNNTTKKVNPNSQPSEPTRTLESKHANSDASLEKSKGTGQTPQLSPNPSSLSTVDDSTKGNGSLEELGAPLLEIDELGSSRKEGKMDISMHSRSIASSEGQTSEDDETRLRRIGAKERVFGLGKRMGEKLEVKRRQVEEKGRSLVERMRGP